MAAIINFVFFIIDQLLWLMIILIFANAILSWLVAFDVINLRNRFAYSVAHFLEAVTRPILRPLRRIIPPLGGVDISPVITILIIIGIRGYLLPPAHLALLQAVTPGATI